MELIVLVDLTFLVFLFSVATITKSLEMGASKHQDAVYPGIEFEDRATRVHWKNEREVVRTFLALDRLLFNDFFLLTPPFIVFYIYMYTAYRFELCSTAILLRDVS